jgi:hypothetical protein
VILKVFHDDLRQKWDDGPQMTKKKSAVRLKNVETTSQSSVVNGNMYQSAIASVPKAG